MSISVRYIPYPGGKNWMNKPLVAKEKTFKTRAQMERFLDKLQDEGKLHEVLAYSEDKSNPGAAWHDDKEHFWDLASKEAADAGKFDLQHTYLTRQEEQAADAYFSREKGMPNPKRRSRNPAPKMSNLLMPALIVTAIVSILPIFPGVNIVTATGTTTSEKMNFWDWLKHRNVTT